MARALIVDDNLLIRRLLSEILSKGGHEVVGEAEDGLSAPARVQELRPELVTLDLVMPRRGGLATLQHLLTINPAVNVVVCSASLDQRKVIEALRMGAKGFIVKPFAAESVLKNVREALGHAASGGTSSTGPSPDHPSHRATQSAFSCSSNPDWRRSPVVLASFV